MSYHFVRNGANMLEMGIKQKRISLSEFLKNDFTLAGLSRKLPTFSQFVIDNIKNINMHAFPKEIDPKNILQSKSFYILMANFEMIYMYLQKNFKPYMELLKERLTQQDGDIVRPMEILQHIFIQNNPIATLSPEESADFFTLLLENIHHICIFELLFDIIRQQKDQNPNWLTLFNSWDILTQYLAKEIPQAFIIANYMLRQFNDQNQDINDLTSPETVTNIFKIALTSQNARTAELAFKYLINVQEVLRPEKYPNFKSLNSHRDDLVQPESEDDPLSKILDDDLNKYLAFLETIGQMQDEVAKFIISTPEFTPVKRQAVIFMLNYHMRVKISTLAMYNVLLFLNEQLMHYPCNNFLSISFVECLGDVINAENYAEFSLDPIFETILNTTNEKKNIHASFWGPINKAARDLNQLILTDKVKQPEQWQTFLTHYLIPEQRIERSDYGGFSDENRKDANKAKRYMCVDQEDEHKLPPELTAEEGNHEEKQEQK